MNVLQGVLGALFFLIVLQITTAESMSNTFVINIMYDSGNITLKNVYISTKNYQQQPFPAEIQTYHVLLASTNKIPLTDAAFVFEKQDGETKNQTQILRQLIFPYNRAYANIQIYDFDGTKILDEMITEKLIICGDGTCEEREKSYCVSDCVQNENPMYLQQSPTPETTPGETIHPEETPTPEETTTREILLSNIFPIFATFVLILIAVNLLRKKIRAEE
jgi:hypothetical protein